MIAHHPCKPIAHGGDPDRLLQSGGMSVLTKVSMGFWKHTGRTPSPFAVQAQIEALPRVVTLKLGGE